MGDNAIGMPNVRALHNAKHSRTVSWVITGGSLREIFQREKKKKDREGKRETMTGSCQNKMEITRSELTIGREQLPDLKNRVLPALSCPFPSVRRGNAHLPIAEAAGGLKTVLHWKRAPSPPPHTLLKDLLWQTCGV